VRFTNRRGDVASRPGHCAAFSLTPDLRLAYLLLLRLLLLPFDVASPISRKIYVMCAVPQGEIFLASTATVSFRLG